MPDQNTVQIGGIPIAIGMPLYGIGPAAGTSVSLFKTAQFCTSRNILIDLITFATSYVHISRNVAVDEFLKGECKKLFFIDQDMVWEPEDFARLIAYSTKYPVVSATYLIKSDTADKFCFGTGDNPEGRNHGLLKVASNGLGFCILDRDLLQRMADEAEKIEHPLTGEPMANLFRVDLVQGKKGMREHRGEDVAFFADLAEMGVECLIDPSIELGHVGQHEWRARLADIFKPQQERAA